MTNGLAGWSGTWKENDWKTGDKEVWGRDIWIDLSELVKNVKIFGSHANVHQRVTSTEKDLNKQEDKTPCSAIASQFLSQFTSIITQWVHEQSDWDGDYSWANNKDFHTTSLICL